MTVEELRQLKQDVEKFGTYSAYVQNEAKKHNLKQEDILPFINRNKIIIYIADCFTAFTQLISMLWKNCKDEVILIMNIWLHIMVIWACTMTILLYCK